MRIETKVVGSCPEGAVTEYSIGSPGPLQVRVVDLGATLTSVRTPDRTGRMGEVTLCYDAPELVANLNPPFFGSTVGRFANRIAGGVFVLDGRKITLERNENDTNHLHGGRQGWSHRLWKAEPLADGVRFRLSSPDGDQGYPGSVAVTANYRVDDAATLHMEYEAVADAPTVVNMTNHAYWNLSGEETVLDHLLCLHAVSYLEVDAALRPTGRLPGVEGSAFDFRSPRRIGERIRETAIGYDHCFVVDGGGGSELARVAELHSPSSGRRMEILSTQAGVQLYTGNYLDRAGYKLHRALCLETQGFPDAPNHPSFPTAVLRPGQTYRRRTVHRFSAG